jgi:hypothetical protein
VATAMATMPTIAMVVVSRSAIVVVVAAILLS